MGFLTVVKYLTLLMSLMEMKEGHLFAACLYILIAIWSTIDQIQFSVRGKKIETYMEIQTEHLL